MSEGRYGGRKVRVVEQEREGFVDGLRDQHALLPELAVHHAAPARPVTGPGRRGVGGTAKKTGGGAGGADGADPAHQYCVRLAPDDEPAVRRVSEPGVPDRRVRAGGGPGGGPGFVLRRLLVRLCGGPWKWWGPDRVGVRLGVGGRRGLVSALRARHTALALAKQTRPHRSEKCLPPDLEALNPILPPELKYALHKLSLPQVNVVS